MKTRHPSSGIISVFMLLFSIVTAFSQENAEPPVIQSRDTPAPLYSLGDQMFTINLGMTIPLFFQSPAGAFTSTQLSLGGMALLRWESFLNGSLAVGGEVAGSLTFSPNGNGLVLIPFTARISYFFRNYPFEFPIALGAGINLTKLNEYFHVEPIVRPSVGAYWSFNSEWSFGLNLTYSWIPQIYGGPTPPAEHTRFGNFLDISLSALYHF